jgi:hypothetical protein
MWYSNVAVGKAAKIPLLNQSFSQVPVLSTQVRSKELFSTAGNVVTTGRENGLPTYVKRLMLLHRISTFEMC